MNIKTRKLIITGMLTAICFIFLLTGISYIYIPFSPVQITIMGLPVIIGTIMEGLYPGLFLGFIFGATSLIDALTKPTVMGLLLPKFPFEIVLVIFIPRLLVPLFTWLVYHGICGKEPSIKRQSTATAIAAVTGSITNTIFFLGMLMLLIKPENLSSVFHAAVGTVYTVILAIIASNGIPEAIFIAVITVPVVLALKRIYLSTAKNKLKKA